MQIDICQITKRFGSIVANQDISLTVKAGSIHGLLGENGAGKSTLVKILSGFLSRDQGEILLNDTLIELRNPAEAIQVGIGMLHQDPMDFPSLTVLDNFIAGRRRGIWIDRRQARQQLQYWSQDLGFDLDSERRVRDLSVGERQQLEITRLLSLGVKILILDEPTTGISASQKQILFAALKTLASQGHSILFVSHKLADVQILCDRATVLRRGQVVGQVEIPCPLSQLVEMMFGQELATPIKPDVRQDGIGLDLKQLQARDGHLQIRVEELQVRRGEVIGLAGLEGSGQRVLLRACTGLLRAIGQIQVGGQDLSGGHYRQFLKAGVRYLPADRLREGLIPGLSIRDHFALCHSLQPTSKTPSALGGLINTQAILHQTQQAIEQFRIRGQSFSWVDHLSGGNQQRTQLALLPHGIELLLMEHPTRGLDIESAVWIWQQLTERCRAGTCILFTSSDLDEIMHYSDRVMVFSGGQVSTPMESSQLTVEGLGELIGGRFEELPVD